MNTVKKSWGEAMARDGAPRASTRKRPVFDRVATQTTGEILSKADRRLLNSVIEAVTLETVAADVGLSPVTVSKAATGFPVSAGTLYKITAQLADVRPAAGDDDDDGDDEEPAGEDDSE
jgi:hypothetical protein